MISRFESIMAGPYFGRWLLAGIFVLAACAQASLWVVGLYAVSADESARAIMSHEVTWATALDFEIWPPFYKMAVGAGLWVYDDLFVTPRAIAFVMGLAMLGALAYLAHRLFNDRTVVIITAALGVCLPHRVVFGAAPQSEMFYNVFVVMGLAFFAGWVRKGAPRDVLWAAAFLALASLVRFEAWFISAVFGLTLAHLHFTQKRLSFLTLALCGVIVSSAPLTIIGRTYARFGSLDPLFITGVQAEMFGTTKITLMTHNHIYLFLHDLLLTPLLLSIIPLVLLTARDRALRLWVIFLGATLAVVAAVTIASDSVSYAATWRLCGIWTLALVPFLAVWIVDFAKAYAQGPGRESLRRTLTAGATVICMVGFAFNTMDIARGFNDSFSAETRQVGRYLRTALAETPGNVLLVPSNFDFLNVIVAANAPDRIVLSTGARPLKAALYAGYDDFWRRKDPAIYKTYLEPKYGLDRGGDPDKLAERSIAFVVSEDPAHGTALEAAGRGERVAAFGPWSVYKIVH